MTALSLGSSLRMRRREDHDWRYDDTSTGGAVMPVENTDYRLPARRVYQRTFIATRQIDTTPTDRRSGN
jgi:hypothetical protein